MRCPYCRKTERWKWNSPRWMRWTPGPMELWRCASCGKEYTIWWWLCPLRNHGARAFVHVWQAVVLILVVLALMFLLMPS